MIVSISLRLELDDGLPFQLTLNLFGRLIKNRHYYFHYFTSWRDFTSIIMYAAIALLQSEIDNTGAIKVLQLVTF